MIKILVHAPKGGVGKTTLATNIALLLARKGYRVWALDLAQGEQMSRYLRNTPEFDNGNKIETRELESLPPRFTGSNEFDYLVADTDDYYQIISDLADNNRSRGWRIIVPIMDEFNGLERIPDELASLMITIYLRGSERPRLKVVANNISKENPVPPIGRIRNALETKGIIELFSDLYITHCESQPPYYIDDTDFHTELEAILEEMEVN